MSNPQSKPNLEDHVEISMETRLCLLTDGQVEHLCLGLINNFGASIGQPPELKLLGFFMLTVASGQVVGIDGTCTVQDVWKLAEAAEKAGGLPWSVSGIKDLLSDEATI